MENVSNTAVWGSLIASVFLGAFIWGQALTDPPRRWRFAFFAGVCTWIATLDFLHAWLAAETYELLRIPTWSLYGASVVWLLALPGRWVVASAAAPCLSGMTVWLLGRHDMATTATLPISFAIAAFAHARHYGKHQGYSSAVLSAYTYAVAALCSVYYEVIMTGDARVIGLGYAHYALLNVVAVMFGWVQLPRELRGRAPVQVERRHALAFFAAVALAETMVILGLLPFFAWPPTLYVAGTVVLLLATVILYLHHSHRLVIYTDNVAALLDERTASLSAAREELARQNETQAEKLRAQARELKEKAEVIERQRRLELAAQTAGQTAHDLQNLVSPILQDVSRLVLTVGAPRDVRETAGRIRRQVEGILDLNAQLLTLARRGRMDFQPVPLAQLLEELRGRFPGRRLEVEADANAWVQGSWSQLARALTNLVTNAFEAQPAREDRVWLRCGVVDVAEQRRCHLGFLAPGRYAAVEVVDTGPGIPPEHSEHIFEPFFSLKRPGEGSGSGLGLSIVTAVVDDHRGVLDLATGPHGTCFTLYLPAIAPVDTSADDAALCGTETVLLADDDPAIRDQYGRMLAAAGYQVVTVADGAEAVQTLQGRRVDALLLDLKMPGLDGFETFLGALHVQGPVRAVVHSSYVTSAEAERLRAAGVSALLQKPASRREVLRALRQALREPERRL